MNADHSPSITQIGLSLSVFFGLIASGLIVVAFLGLLSWAVLGIFSAILT